MILNMTEHGTSCIWSLYAVIIHLNLPLNLRTIRSLGIVLSMDRVSSFEVLHLQSSETRIGDTDKDSCQYGSQISAIRTKFCTQRTNEPTLSHTKTLEIVSRGVEERMQRGRRGDTYHSDDADPKAHNCCNTWWQ